MAPQITSTRTTRPYVFASGLSNQPARGADNLLSGQIEVTTQDPIVGNGSWDRLAADHATGVEDSAC